MKYPYLLLLLFITRGICFGQNSKKETVEFYRALHNIDTNDIKNGQYLDRARNGTIETFVPYYLEHGKIEDNKKYGYLMIKKLYQDSAFTYFVQSYDYGLTDFFKIKTNDLAQLDLNKLEGKTIRKQFIEEIVPAADKEKVERKKRPGASLYDNAAFTYQYNKNSGYILITYKWKVSGQYMFNIINKTYSANLDLKTYKLTKK